MIILGTLSFSLNGEFMGVAFRSEILKKGPIYAAVALLHCAGCTLKTGKAKPANMEWLIIKLKTLFYSKILFLMLFLIIFQLFLFMNQFSQLFYLHI